MNKILASLTLGLSLITLSVTHSAHADSYSCFSSVEDNRLVNKNEAVVLCSGGNSAGVAACLNMALDERTLSNNEAKSLCIAAPTEAPIKCYQQVVATRDTRRMLNSNEAQAACKGVSAEGGVTSCLLSADRVRTLSRNEKVTLCSGANDATPVTCYERAEGDRLLSGNQAVELCRTRDRFRL